MELKEEQFLVPQVVFSALLILNGIERKDYQSVWAELGSG